MKQLITKALRNRVRAHRQTLARHASVAGVAVTALLINAQSVLAQDVIGNTGRTVHTALNTWANDWSPVGWAVGIGSMFFGARGRVIGAAAAGVTLGLTHIDQIHSWIKGF